MICVGRSSVSFSIPLATETIGTPAGTCGLSRFQTPRMYCVGIAERISVAPAKQSASLAVSRTLGGTRTPGSSRRFSRFWISRSIDSSNAPHIVTPWPPCVSRIEQTVAIAPSPRMVMCSGIAGKFRAGRAR